jgi:hypothetical protein
MGRPVNWGRNSARRQIDQRGMMRASSPDRPYEVPRHRFRPGYGNVEAAARWLTENRQRLRDEGRNPVPELQHEFGLSSKQACEAIRLSGRGAE